MIIPDSNKKYQTSKTVFFDSLEMENSSVLQVLHFVSSNEDRDRDQDFLSRMTENFGLLGSQLKYLVFKIKEKVRDVLRNSITSHVNSANRQVEVKILDFLIESMSETETLIWEKMIFIRLYQVLDFYRSHRRILSFQTGTKCMARYLDQEYETLIPKKPEADSDLSLGKIMSCPLFQDWERQDYGHDPCTVLGLAFLGISGFTRASKMTQKSRDGPKYDLQGQDLMNPNFNFKLLENPGPAPTQKTQDLNLEFESKNPYLSLTWFMPWVFPRQGNVFVLQVRDTNFFLKTETIQSYKVKRNIVPDTACLGVFQSCLDSKIIQKLEHQDSELEHLVFGQREIQDRDHPKKWIQMTSSVSLNLRDIMLTRSLRQGLCEPNLLSDLSSYTDHDQASEIFDKVSEQVNDPNAFLVNSRD